MADIDHNSSLLILISTLHAQLNAANQRIAELENAQTAQKD